MTKLSILEGMEVSPAIAEPPLKPLGLVGGQQQLLVLGVKSSGGFTVKSRF